MSTGDLYHEQKANFGPQKFHLHKNNLFYVGDFDFSVLIMDIRTKEISNILLLADSSILSLNVSKCGKFVFVGCFADMAQVFDLESNKKTTLKDHTDSVRCVIQGKDGEVITGCMDGRVRIFDMFTGELKRSHTSDALSDILCLLYDSKRQWIIFSYTYRSTITVCDYNSMQELYVLCGHAGRVSSMAFLGEDEIVSGSSDATVKIWNIATGTDIKTIRTHSLHVSSVSVTTDRHQVLSSSGDKSVCIVDYKTGKQVQKWGDFTSPVLKATLSEDGKFLVVGLMRDKIEIYKVNPCFPFVVHRQPCYYNGATREISVMTNGRCVDDEGTDVIMS